MSKKILIVEDDLATQAIYQEKLRHEGYEVRVTGSGSEGLTMILKDPPDLLILDVMLGGKLNGFDVLEDMKKRPNTKEIPVLVLTNLGSEEKVAKKIGAVEYLIKANTSLEEVTGKVNEILSRQMI